MTKDVPQFIGELSRDKLEQMYRKFTDYEWYVLQDGIDPNNIQSQSGLILDDIDERFIDLDEIVSFYRDYEPFLEQANAKKLMEKDDNALL